MGIRGNSYGTVLGTLDIKIIHHNYLKKSIFAYKYIFSFYPHIICQNVVLILLDFYCGKKGISKINLFNNYEISQFYRAFFICSFFFNYTGPRTLFAQDISQMAV